MRKSLISEYEMYRDVICSSAGDSKLTEIDRTLRQFSRALSIKDPYFVNSLLRKLNEHTGLLEVQWRERKHMNKYRSLLEQAWTEVTDLKLFEHECIDCPGEYF